MAVQWPIMKAPVTEDIRIIGEESELGPYKEGDVITIYKVRRTGENPKLEVQPNFSLSVLFDEGSPAPNEGLFQTLDRVNRITRGVVNEFAWRFD